MPTIGTTTRPAYVYDLETDTWIPVGTGPHTHTTAISDVTGLQAALDAEVSNANYFAAGKNKIINGDFSVNQRAFSSVTNPNTAPYSFDRWLVYAGTPGSSNAVFSSQTFTPGAAPVTGYESANFLRVVTTSQDATNSIVFPQQRIEDVRTFAGQTATISFWAKANSGTPKVFLELSQVFGSGGSPSSAVDVNCGQVTLSTSWARYSVTATMPSISGKTIGTTSGTSYLSFQMWVSAGSTFNSRTGSLGAQNNTFDFWGVQLEAGSVATAFQTATGTIQGELQACQRYYWRQNTRASNYSTVGNGWAASTSAVKLQVKHPVTMRTEPTSIDANGLYVWDGTSLIGSLNSIALEYSNESYLNFTAGTAGGSFVANRPYSLLMTYPTAWIGCSAEL